MNRRTFLRHCACCATLLAASPIARAAAVPALDVVEMADGVWRHTSWNLLPDGTPFPSNGLIVTGGERTLVIDTTWRTDDMPALLDRADEIGRGKPLLLTCTHAHADRMSGIAVARARGVRSIVHAFTQEDAPRRALPRADETWGGAVHSLALGGRTVELFMPGAAHTRDNVVAHVGHESILFGGCMFRTARIGLGNTADGDPKSYAASVRNVIARYGAKTRLVVPGHDDPGGRELLKVTLDLAEKLKGP